ncbi:FAD-dependent oxidoreductase [Holophaga foetida]|uniref:FAD-dependent oxidoreductase n=1 Tax=Holophaga foetida TaxID=35839 RepID=UPI0002473B0D|nr:FAD-dependent oxidoreductase [Holophaga foetida]
MASVTFKLNGKEVVADNSKTILQVARDNGVDIPTLCYDPRLPPYGSCLVCVVEVRNMGRTLMSCTTPVGEGMDIWTDSESALKARKSALEMLLSNHYADCRGPCYVKCPANVDIQGYLAFANAGLYKEALDLIRETNPMPLSCGRVCVRYCEANCRRQDVDSPGAINFMKRYVADLEYDRLGTPEPVPSNGKKVAIVGGGPSGLTCGYYLRQQGFEVTILDKQPKLGGMLRYGIPEYRLPQAVLDKEVKQLLSGGIQVRTEVKLGQDFTLDSLKAEGFDAIYLALGSWVAKGMGLENENHPNILPGIVFLEGVKRNGPPELKGNVAIVGGGNTAIDAARTALRCGADKVTVLYRRTRTEMPADDIEVEDAIEEGVEFAYLTAPNKVVTEGDKLLGLECYLMELGEPDASGRRKPEKVKGSEFLFKADWVVSAIGQDQDLSGLKNQTLGEIKTTKWNSIEADPETLLTSVEGVFAGGDAMSGPAAAIDAIAAGGRAAKIIEKWFKTGKVEKFQAGFLSKRAVLEVPTSDFFVGYQKAERPEMPKLDRHERAKNWEEVDLGVTADQVKAETNRCLSCGCNSVFDCDLKVFSGNYDVQQEHFKGKLKKHKMDDRHPYIILDANKCILCGRCVRYCGELINVSALGFIDRGYDTVVKPSLNKALADTTCISCGNCIEVCPTGAITFKANLEKPGPYRTAPYRSACSFCGVGCELDINHSGRDYFFVTAKPIDPFIEGELCAKGRFGTYYVGSRDRIANPELKGRGKVEMGAAASALAAGLKAFNGEEILFLASPRISNETAFLFASLAKQFGSRNVFAAEDLRRPSLPGAIASTLKQEAVEQADLIVTVGENVVTYNPVFAFKVRRALTAGAKLIHVGPADLAWKRLATCHIPCAAGEEAQVLSALSGAILKAGLQDGASVATASNAAALQGFGFAAASEAIERAAAFFKDAAKPAVIVNRDAAAGSDGSELQWAADLALLTGAGLLVVRNEANGQGFQDIVYGGGFASSDDLVKAQAALASGAIKAVVLLGVDPEALPCAEALAKVPFTAVLDLFGTEATERADVRVPLSPLAEEDGSTVAFDGRVIKFRRAFKPLAGFDNVSFLGEALQATGGTKLDLTGVRSAIVGLLPRYATLSSETPNVYLADAAPRAFCLAPMLGTPVSSYASATTFTRRWEKTNHL